MFSVKSTVCAGFSSFLQCVCSLVQPMVKVPPFTKIRPSSGISAAASVEDDVFGAFFVGLVGEQQFVALAEFSGAFKVFGVHFPGVPVGVEGDGVAGGAALPQIIFPLGGLLRICLFFHQFNDHGGGIVFFLLLGKSGAAGEMLTPMDARKTRHTKPNILSPFCNFFMYVVMRRCGCWVPDFPSF